MQISLEGHDRPIAVEAGDTILASLLRAGVPFPFSCQAGNCGTCKCELLSGDILELEHSAHALSAEERAKGIILACRTQVWDDTAIRRIDALCGGARINERCSSGRRTYSGGPASTPYQ